MVSGQTCIAPKIKSNVYSFMLMLTVSSASARVSKATGHTGIYTPPTDDLKHTGVWSSGPDLPNDSNGNIRVIDSPACLLPNSILRV
jgi:hypothetical protein